MRLPALLTFNTGLFSTQKRYANFYADDDADDENSFSEMVSDIDNASSIDTQGPGDELLEEPHNPPPAANLVFPGLKIPAKNGYEVLNEGETAEV